jgi:DNA-binding transcriptional MerR regulator
MRYKINDVKRILNIKEETLRYFDKKNIIKTTRDQKNNYRYFKAEDINKIFAYKMYRSLLFSLNDSNELVSGKPLPHLERKLSEQIEVIEKEQKYLNQVKLHISILSEKLKKWNSFTGGFEITESEECYYHPNQTDTCFIQEADVFENTYLCLDYLPSIWPCFYYNYSAASPEFSFGYGLYTNHTPPINGLIHLPPVKCLYTMISLEDNLLPSIPDILEQADTYCCQNNHKLKGILYGSILHEMKESELNSRLFELYLPID